MIRCQWEKHKSGGLRQGGPCIVCTSLSVIYRAVWAVLSIRRNFFMEVLNVGTDCPGRWSHCPWGCSRNNQVWHTRGKVVISQRLDSMISELSSKLNDSVILSYSFSSRKMVSIFHHQVIFLWWLFLTCATQQMAA